MQVDPSATPSRKAGGQEEYLNLMQHASTFHSRGTVRSGARPKPRPSSATMPNRLLGNATGAPEVLLMCRRAMAIVGNSKPFGVFRQRQRFQVGQQPNASAAPETAPVPFEDTGPDPASIPQTANEDMFPSNMDGNAVDFEDFFTSAPLLDWIIMVCVCVVMFSFDFIVLSRAPDKYWVHCAVLLWWLAVAWGYAWLTWNRMGSQAFVQWIIGYVLEWMLSVDNLFVFYLIFNVYKVPAAQVPYAVRIGVALSIVMRMVFFLVVASLMTLAVWVHWPFGIILIWSGVETARADDDDDDEEGVTNTIVMRGVNWLIGSRLAPAYTKQAALTTTDASGRFQFTPLVVVVICLEITDIIFAVDSVTAKVAQIPNGYLAYSSSCVSTFGLRAAFFVVRDLVDAFSLLKYGLSFILVFIGVELILSYWISLSPVTMLIIIATVFCVCIVGSYAKKIKPLEICAMSAPETSTEPLKAEAS